MTVMKVGTRFKIEFEVVKPGSCRAVGGGGYTCNTPDTAAEPLHYALYGATPLDIVEPTPPTPVFKLGDMVKGPGGSGVYIRRLGHQEVYRVIGYPYETDKIGGLDTHSCVIGELEAE